MKKPLNIWIEFGGDPSNDKEVYKRYSSTSAFKPVGLDAEVIHCVDYTSFMQVYEELETLTRLSDKQSIQYHQLRKEIKKLSSIRERPACGEKYSDSPDNWISYGALEVILERYKKALEKCKEPRDSFMIMSQDAWLDAATIDEVTKEYNAKIDKILNDEE